MRWISFLCLLSIPKTMRRIHKVLHDICACTLGYRHSKPARLYSSVIRDTLRLVNACLVQHMLRRLSLTDLSEATVVFAELRLTPSRILRTSDIRWWNCATSLAWLCSRYLSHVAFIVRVAWWLHLCSLPRAPLVLCSMVFQDGRVYEKFLPKFAFLYLCFDAWSRSNHKGMCTNTSSREFLLCRPLSHCQC